MLQSVNVTSMHHMRERVLCCRMRVSMGLKPLAAASSTTTREAKEAAAGKARVQERESKAASASARERISRFALCVIIRAKCLLRSKHRRWFDDNEQPRGTCGPRTTASAAASESLRLAGGSVAILHSFVPARCPTLGCVYHADAAGTWWLYDRHSARASSRDVPAG